MGICVCERAGERECERGRATPGGGKCTYCRVWMGRRCSAAGWAFSHLLGGGSWVKQLRPRWVKWWAELLDPRPLTQKVREAVVYTDAQELCLAGKATSSRLTIGLGP